VQKQSILVLANEDVISALLGAMVELDGFRPIFPAVDERPLVAVWRHRPDLILLDAEHELAWDTDAMRRISSSGARVLIFSAMRSQHEIEQIGARWGMEGFVLPVAFREFAERIERVMSDGGGDLRAIGA
jgi:DNA-binding response OmpR family regulator